MLVSSVQTGFPMLDHGLKNSVLHQKSLRCDVLGHTTMGLMLFHGYFWCEPRALAEDGVWMLRLRSEPAPTRVIFSPPKRVPRKGDSAQDGSEPTGGVLQRACSQAAVGNRLLSSPARSAQAVPLGRPAHEVPEGGGQHPPGHNRPGSCSSRALQLHRAPRLHGGNFSWQARLEPWPGRAVGFPTRCLVM